MQIGVGLIWDTDSPDILDNYQSLIVTLGYFLWASSAG